MSVDENDDVLAETVFIGERDGERWKSVVTSHSANDEILKLKAELDFANKKIAYFDKCVNVDCMYFRSDPDEEWLKEIENAKEDLKRLRIDFDSEISGRDCEIAKLKDENRQLRNEYDSELGDKDCNIAKLETQIHDLKSQLELANDNGRYL